MSLSKELAALIERYCQGKNHSLSTLSRESRVPYGSVKRIAQGEVVPELYNALKILMVVQENPDECFLFINKHYQDVGQFLSRVNHQPSRRNLSSALEDKVSFYIVHLAATRGTSRQEVLREFGLSGLASLESLVEKKVVKEVGDRIEMDDFSYPSIDSVLTQMRFLLEDFNPKPLGDGKSMASLQIFGMNERGSRKIYEAQKAFLERVCEIKDQEEFKGEKVMFLTTLFNSFWEDK